MSESELNRAALSVHRLAGLLEAGLSLAKAKQELSAELVALEPGVSQQLERILALAELYGSPTRDLLADLAADLRRRARLGDRIKVISALPKSTARLVSWLPVGCLAAAQLLGLSPLDAITHNLFASASVAIGLVLLWLSSSITDRMVAKAELRVQSRVTDLNASAETALALLAGLPIGRIDANRLTTSVQQTFELANRNGLAVGTLLRNQLAVEQDALAVEVETAIERLQVTLLLPVGLLVLPALALLAIIPTTIALITK